MSSLVVTTQIGGAKKTQVWHPTPSTPLALGHPFRWVMEKTKSGIRIRDMDLNRHSIQRARLHEVSNSQISAGVEIDLSPLKIFIKPTRALEAASSSKAGNIAPLVKWIEDQTLPRVLESVTFQKMLRYTAIGFATFIILSLIWPKPKQDELIPAQFAKIVLSQPKSSPANSETKTDSAQNPASAKVQNSAVVQAFRAKALQNAVNGLLKGGMTRLLEQSDFVAGSSSNEAKRLFDAKSDSLRATAPDNGIVKTDLKVTAVGGADASGKGYAKGEHAGVEGQGHSFVSMNVADSTVEEGLTKDEVGEVIHRHLSEVRYCYESAMLRQPDIEGKLVINFVIGSVGGVNSSEVKSSTLPDPRLDDCVLRRLGTWKFPKPKGGINVAVSYPFIFKTLGK